MSHRGNLSLPKGGKKARMVRKEEESMQEIIKLANEEIARLEKLYKTVDMRLKNVPEGSLKFQNIDGKTYYYHQYMIKEDETKKSKDKAQNTREKKRGGRVKIEYIKKNSALATELANKQYYISLKQAITNNLNQLKGFVGKYQGNIEDEIYDSLAEERKRLVSPLQISIKEQVKSWEAEDYEKNNNYPENLRYETEQGDIVRSKSEVIIANILYKHRKDILYKYEKPLLLMIGGLEKFIYPDFTIINIHTGKIVYWEHAGLMDDAHYANEFVRKMNSYISNGLILGIDVIVTYETQGNPLDIGIVKKLIEQVI